MPRKWIQKLTSSTRHSPPLVGLCILKGVYGEQQYLLLGSSHPQSAPQSQLHCTNDFKSALEKIDASFDDLERKLGREMAVLMEAHAMVLVFEFGA